MLDSITKKRIDDCRDILVGKLPDPKAQIEQITIALIYKFMDDMDKEAIELGGKAKFFSNYSIPDPKDPEKKIIIEFEKYSWENLFDTKVTANEMLTLYSDAIAAMDKNPNIPQLFRDIFKNAFLPYRDPETLKLFLKTIGEFEYTHSEKLGDAFEYLLSVMGSQGDAGQFRTPRHIIDFLVAVVDPSKTDTILDPACGTAGFLISAYKHVLLKDSKANIAHLNIYQYNNNSNTKPFNSLGDLFTPDDRRKVIKNFTGYDISPDMVRLSLVNLYLHGFSDPHIWEYDTLSSEDRWNETFDVILANPPFMSPKGGIRPHKKFSISSNRSEVLFVDYIAEHLNPNGKAGVIVPEGVIFQSGTAYKDLRKMLVDNYLYAVVSLPAGVFNPYSGVKTSILLMDKEFAKAEEEILFVKIDNDGYGLGAQRNAVKGSQLDEAIEVLKQFKEGSFTESALAHSVPKVEITKNGDYNLSGDRYKIIESVGNSKFPLVEIKEICEIQRGGSPRPIEEYITFNEDGINWIKIGDVAENAKYITQTKEKIKQSGVNKTRLVQDGDFILSNSMSFGRPYIVKISGAIHDGWLLLRMKDNRMINQDFLYEILRSDLIKRQYEKLATGGVVRNLNSNLVSSVQIPLPPISIQKEIVAEIETYQKIIDGAKMVVENYKPRIDIDPDWDMVELGQVFTKVNENVFPEELNEKIINYVGLENISQGTGYLIGNYKTNPKEIKSTKIVFHKEDILYGKLRPNLNKVYFSEIEGICSTDFFVIRGKESISPRFYSNFLLSENFNREVLKGLKGAQLPRVGYESFSQILVPYPKLEIQHQIVFGLEKEQEYIKANIKLIEIFEQKIKDRIAKVWDE